MKDALNAVAASLPAPKVRWISAIRGEDMGCIINMDKNREKMYIYRACAWDGESMRFFAILINGGE